jgi:hypothetical protein
VPLLNNKSVITMTGKVIVEAAWFWNS